MLGFRDMYELEPSDVRIESEYDLEYDPDRNEIVAFFEVWFDADKKFNIHVEDEPGTWVNLYAMWNPFNNNVRVMYEIDRPDGSEFNGYVPTENEVELFKSMISEATEKFFGQSPIDFAKEAMA